MELVGRLTPLAPIDEVVPVGNQVPERATLVAERNPAVHAPRALARQLLLGLELEVLVVVAHALTWVALVETDPVDLQECAELTHGTEEGTNGPLRTVAYSAVAVLGRCVAVGLPRSPPASAERQRPPSKPAVTLQPSPAELTSGQTVTLHGQAPPGATGPAEHEPDTRTRAPPQRAPRQPTGGAFSFTVRPDRNTRYRAEAVAATPSATVTVEVLGLTITKVRALPLGRARVTMVVFHPRDLQWGGAKVQWWFASGSQGAFAAAPSTNGLPAEPIRSSC